MANTLRQQLGDEDDKAFLQILVQLNAQYQKLQARINPLSFEDPKSHAALEQMRLENYSSRAYDAVEVSIDLYSRAINTNFASHILRLLPREIRDMIYHQLVNSECVAVDGKKRMEDVTVPIRIGEPLESGKSYLAPRRTLESFPHFYSQDYMGVEFASELVESAYRYHTFAFHHQAQVSAYLGLSECMFGTGLNPAAHITSLTIGITLNQLRISKVWVELPTREFEWSSPKWYYPLQRHFQKAVQPLDVLKKIGLKRRSSIQFLNRYDEVGYKQKFAEVLMPLIYELKEKGWKILCWAPEFESPWETLTFDSPRDAWEEKIRTNSVFMIRKDGKSMDVGGCDAQQIGFDIGNFAGHGRI